MKGLAASDNTTPSPVFGARHRLNVSDWMVGLLKDSNAPRQPRRDLVLRSVVLPRAAARRPAPAPADRRAERAAAGFWRSVPAPFAAATLVATVRFMATVLDTAFLPVGFAGAGSSTRSMAAATSAIGAMPLTDPSTPWPR